MRANFGLSKQQARLKAINDARAREKKRGTSWTGVDYSRNCRTCNKPFNTPHAQTVFCSAECQQDHQSALDARTKYLSNRVSAACKHCGNVFFKKRSDHHYCGQNCQKRAVRALKKLTFQTCQSCGSDISEKRVGARYCSNRCKKIIYNASKTTTASNEVVI